MPAAAHVPPNAASQITICACGTSWHAALVGEYLLETLANIRVEVEYASEFRYRRALTRATMMRHAVVSPAAGLLP